MHILFSPGIFPNDSAQNKLMANSLVRTRNMDSLLGNDRTKQPTKGKNSRQQGRVNGGFIADTDTLYWSCRIPSSLVTIFSLFPLCTIKSISLNAKTGSVPIVDEGIALLLDCLLVTCSRNGWWAI